MTKRIMKLTETSAVVKITGSSPETIDLSVDLLSPTQELDPDNDPKVTITFAQWTTGEKILVERDGDEIFELHPNTGIFDFGGYGGFSEDTNATDDIDVTITGGGVLYLTLRKEKGYLSKIEPEYFGQYDNPTKVGE